MPEPRMELEELVERISRPIARGYGYRSADGLSEQIQGRRNSPPAAIPLAIDDHNRNDTACRGGRARANLCHNFIHLAHEPSSSPLEPADRYSRLRSRIHNYRYRHATFFSFSHRCHSACLSFLACGKVPRPFDWFVRWLLRWKTHWYLRSVKFSSGTVRTGKFGLPFAPACVTFACSKPRRNHGLAGWLPPWPWKRRRRRSP